jgi:hypothetical protein
MKSILQQMTKRLAAGGTWGAVFIGTLAMQPLTAIPAVASGETITVTTLDDVVDFSGAQQVADLPGPDGLVSFREATTAANNTAGPQKIEFAIPQSQFWLITNMALLRVENVPGGFTLTDDATTIDFTSQTRNIGDTNPDGNEVGIFSLMSNFTLPQAGIAILGNDCVIKGLDTVRNFGYGIRIYGNNNRVIACHLFDPLGGGAVYASVAIRSDSSVTPTGNTIGGTGPGEGNTLACYPGSAIEITGPATDNVVIGNTLNRSHVAGLLIQAGASGTRIGGPMAAERNVIASNGTAGGAVPEDSDIYLDNVSGTRIEGNYLGTSADGLTAAAPPAAGIEMHGCNKTTIINNVISGYLAEGIHQGLPFRTGIGILITTGPGGLGSNNTVIQGNLMGVGANGVTPLPNAECIRVNPFFPLNMAVSVGGNVSGQGNIIAHSAGSGITVFGDATGVRISGNSIFENGAPDAIFPTPWPGIDLVPPSGTRGQTPNDPGDTDTGGNGLQNFPELSSATTTGVSLSIQGSLDSSALAQFQLEFFASASCDATGFGQGTVFLGSAPVTTNGAGHAAFSVTLPGNVPVGASVTATATLLSTGDTSEFSTCVAATSISTSTPTPPAQIGISGTIPYCSNPNPGPVPSVMLTLTGSASGSTLSDNSGNYSFTALISGGNYTVTPSKSPLPPGSPGINTVDVVAAQRHFLSFGTPLTGCRLTAADVDGDSSVSTVDVIAIQRFYLGIATGTANVGKYRFSPANRTYSGVVNNQTGQNYDTLVFGDVASSFVVRPRWAGSDQPSSHETAPTVARLSLPVVIGEQSSTRWVAAVTTTAINPDNNLVGFQGDFTFDERVIAFANEPVQEAGLTAGNWNVSGNVLAGPGPIRTLRISAFSNDFTPLSGSGTLFDLRMTRVSQAVQDTQLLWVAPPNHFVFIDADLQIQRPVYAAPGSVNTSHRRK